MQHIYLVRHGQASFGAENYDKLSSIGKQQAGVVGDYFANQGIAVAKIIHGKMSRQQETAELIAKNAGYTGELICHQGANEFDSENLIKHYLPILAQQSSSLNQIMESGEDWWATGENFEIFFRALVSMWQEDKNCPFESWDNFRKRCLSCLTDVANLNIDNTKGITLIATSGGLISVIMQTILGSDQNAFMNMNLTINNTSISEIVWQKNYSNDDQLKEQKLLKASNRLLSFNNITPLLLAKRKELITRK